MKPIGRSITTDLKRNKILILMVFPAVSYFILFHYVPMIGILMAFKDYTTGGYREIFTSPWAGLKNFRFFFISGKAALVTINTVLYNLAFIIIGNIAQIFAAIVLSELKSVSFKKISQSMMFLPYFISWVVVGAFIYNIFNYEYGFLNSVLNALGFDSFNAYGTPGAWKYILVSVNTWRWTGYGSIIYLAAIMSIDTEYYDAAKIDGANIFQQIRHITLPLLVPTIIILFLLKLGTLLRGDFQMFYQIIGNAGNLYDATDIIDTYVFRMLTETTELSMAAAAGFYQSVFCLVTILISNYLVRRYNTNYALF
jgi:putative aldouronate transport system permease protein